MGRDKKREDGVEGEGRKERGGDASNLAVLSRDCESKARVLSQNNPCLHSAWRTKVLGNNQGEMRKN